VVDPLADPYRGVVVVDGETIVETHADESAPAGVYVVPGFVDLHVYDDDALERHGITGYLKATRDPSERPVRPELCVGLHLEGPFLNPDMAGAIPPDELAPVDLDALSRWLDGGNIRLVTVSPEIESGLDAIALIAERGAIAAIGHTAANAATVRAALGRGARFATHVWNAMGPVRSRSTGPVPELLLDDRVILGLIADGRHLHPRIEELTIRVAGWMRVALTSDRVPLPAERPDGKLLGGDRCGAALVRRVARHGLPAAVGMASLVPCELLGLADRGRVAQGFRADLAILSAELEPLETIAGGESVWSLGYPRR
jgi:N-acetylglucosamine-6-phosphate deacetylase